MTAPTDWPLRLEQALDYEALRQAFDEIARLAEAGREDPALAHTIDEAVRRIERERASDQGELSEIQARYESFRGDHRGVMGWFKRHLPFSETRRAEVQHREEVADQVAEILADNLVIARAQMLKERLLRSADRRLGLRPAEWQAMIDRRPALDALAANLKELAAEHEPGRMFVGLVEKDVEAFAAAAFKTADDRKRRDDDLATARRELADLTHELKQKDDLLRRGLAEVGRLVSDDLAANDAAFRGDGQQLDRLQAALVRLKLASDATSRLADAAGEIGQLVRERDALPNQTQRLREARRRLEQRKSEAIAQDARATAIVDERSRRVKEAAYAVDDAKRALVDAERAAAGEQAQRLANKSMPQLAEAEAESPVMRRLRECRSTCDAATARSGEANQALDAAKRSAGEARAALDAANSELRATDEQLAELERRQMRLPTDTSAAVEKAQAALATAALTTATYLTAGTGMPAVLPAAPYGWLDGGIAPSLGQALLAANRDYQRHLQASTVLNQLAQWQQTQLAELERRRSSIAEHRAAIWRTRLRDLLGDALASEVPG